MNHEVRLMKVIIAERKLCHKNANVTTNTPVNKSRKQSRFVDRSLRGLPIITHHRMANQRSNKAGQTIMQNANYSDFASSNPFSIKNILELPGNHSANRDEATPDQPDSTHAPGTIAELSSSTIARAMTVCSCSISTRESTENLEKLKTNHPASQSGFQTKQCSHSYQNLALSGGYLTATKEGMKATGKRPHFSSLQTYVMEKEFTECPYITTAKRAKLARRLRLTETQVKTWFQNRRTKWKRETKEKCGPAMFKSKRFWEDQTKQFKKTTVNG